MQEHICISSRNQLSSYPTSINSMQTAQQSTLKAFPISLRVKKKLESHYAKWGFLIFNCGA